MRGALVAVVLAVVALSVASVRLDSATPDEPAHIANGVIKLTEGRPDFFREQPPLMNSLSALPLVLSGYRVQPGWAGVNHWVVGRRLLYRSGYDAHRILFLARLPTIILFAALCLMVYWFVLSQSGSAGWALLAAVMTGFSPNLMAHGRLATVDMALTCFAFSAAAFLFSVAQRPSIGRAAALGITTAAAVLSKVSGLILGPYFVVVVASVLAFRRPQSLKLFARDLAVAAAAALVFFEGFTLAVTSGAWMRETHTTLPAAPFVEYLANVRAIEGWYRQGQAMPQFLLGEFATRSNWPQYYPVALLLKTTIPALLLTVAGAVVVVRRARKDFVPAALLLFVVIFLVFAGAGHIALGLRYVLPVYPFLYAAVAIALAQTSRAMKDRRPLVVTAALLALWHVGENAAAYPSYLSYFNELIGSRRNADKFLIDSNLDWGVDLRRLDLWCRDNKVSQITVHYFGGGDPAVDMPHVRPLIVYSPGPAPLPKGCFALSRHFYRLSFMPGFWPVNYDDYLAASHARYVTTIGGSIDVYRVD